MSRKLLWVGDAGCDSGFARATHKILEAVRRAWDVAVLGINYRGDPHDYPYKIYPAYVPGGDIFGVRRFLDIIDRERPDLIVLQNDAWNFPAYFKRLEELEVPPPVVGIVAVDGLNCLGRALNRLVRAVFWTEFGRDEAVKGGCLVPTGVVPLGVDLKIYHPKDRVACRRAMGLPAEVVDGFIFGNVNRNQPRKRLDLSIRYFARWRDTLPEADQKRVYLYLHVAPTGDQGIDCEQLAKYYGMSAEHPWLILAEPEMYHGAPEHWVGTTYNAFDALISTTQGEGMGLTTLEAMACGIGCIVPRAAALGDWARGGVRYVECSSVSVTPKVNCIGAVPDEQGFIEALDLFYQDPTTREIYGREGMAVARQPRFDWANVAAGYVAEIERAWEGRCGNLGAIGVPACPPSTLG